MSNHKRTTDRLNLLKQGLAPCAKCERTRPVEEFSRYAVNANGLHSYCKECQLFVTRKSRHGIDRDQWVAQYDKQKGKCALCDDEVTYRSGHTFNAAGVFRVLCNNCNTGAGCLRDAPTIHAAIRYLKEPRSLLERAGMAHMVPLTSRRGKATPQPPDLSLKRCGLCADVKPLEQFNKNKSGSRGRASSCKACIPDKKCRDRYGITQTMKEDLIRWQHGLCAICEESPKTRMHIDHDHRTTKKSPGGIKLRGMLCGRCNRGIGLLNEDPALLLQVVALWGEQPNGRITPDR